MPSWDDALDWAHRDLKFQAGLVVSGFFWVLALLTFRIKRKISNEEIGGSELDLNEAQRFFSQIFYVSLALCCNKVKPSSCKLLHDSCEKFMRVRLLPISSPSPPHLPPTSPPPIPPVPSPPFAPP